RIVSPPCRSWSPRMRIACRCAPLATTETSFPVAASFAAMCPPTAPAPNTHSFIPIEYAAMKICRFDDNRLGLVTDDGIRDVSAVLGKLPAVTYPFPRHDALIAYLSELRPEIERAAKSAEPLAVEKVKLLSPVANPG